MYYSMFHLFFSIKHDPAKKGAEACKNAPPMAIPGEDKDKVYINYTYSIYFQVCIV
jgi:hypothetical protein